MPYLHCRLLLMHYCTSSLHQSRYYVLLCMYYYVPVPNFSLIYCLLQQHLLKKNCRALGNLCHACSQVTCLALFLVPVVYTLPACLVAGFQVKEDDCLRIWCCCHGTASGAVNTVFSYCVSTLPMNLSSGMPKAAVTPSIREARIIIL